MDLFADGVRKRVECLSDHLVAPVEVPLETPGDHALNGDWNLQLGRERRRGTGHDAFADLVERLPLERERAGEDLIGEGAERPDVVLWIARSPRPVLRRHERRRPGDDTVAEDLTYLGSDR